MQDKRVDERNLGLAVLGWTMRLAHTAQALRADE